MHFWQDNTKQIIFQISDFSIDSHLLLRHLMAHVVTEVQLDTTHGRAGGLAHGAEWVRGDHRFGRVAVPFPFRIFHY
jgi:hypothetical protein